MSEGSLGSAALSRPYRHSPLDDAWSFFFTAAWAIVFFSKADDQSLKDVAALMIQPGKRASAIVTLLSIAVQQESQYFATILSRLLQYHDELLLLQIKYEDRIADLRQPAETQSLAHHCAMFDVTLAAVKAFLVSTPHEPSH